MVGIELSTSVVLLLQRAGGEGRSQQTKGEESGDWFGFYGIAGSYLLFSCWAVKVEEPGESGFIAITYLYIC